MGDIFSTPEADPREVDFLGMKFKCNEEYFESAIREEVEIILYPIYMNYWWQVQIFGIFGWIFAPFKSLGLAIKEDWNSKIEVFTSFAKIQWALYVLNTQYRMEWAICDTVMFKYWIFHPINFWFIPELNPLVFIEEALKEA